jgi:serine/threonine protein kinase
VSGRQPAPPPDLPGFAPVSLLGSGGFADVYLYTQLGLGRQVAVKVLVGGVSGSDLSSFQAEANVMAQLSNHPSIVSIYQADVTADGRAFLVMEYCPPPHLGLQIRQRAMGVAKALEVTIQLAGAVETAHRLGILHRDIKPANILFTEFGRPALTDFGISVTTHSGQSGAGVGMSVPWAPPEQLTAGAAMGPAGDVYALAATLWTALVGRSPFHVVGGANDPMSMAPRVRTQPLPATGRPDVPESLERVLRTAMSKDPAVRFSTALEFARALQAVQAELHLSVTPIEVRDERIDLGDAEDEDEGGTRVTGFVSIDPEVRARTSRGDQTSTSSTVRGVVAPAWTPPGTAASEDATVLKVAHPAVTDTVVPAPGAPAATTPAPTPAAPAGPSAPPAAPSTPDATPPGAPAAGGTGRWIKIGLTAAVVVAAAGGIIAMLLNGPDVSGTTDDHKDPTGSTAVDPLAGVVPAPADLTVVRRAGTVTATWTNPDPESGDRFVWKLNDPTQATEWTTTNQTTVTIPGKPAVPCVLVQLKRADGRSSQSSEACAKAATP